MTSLTVKCKAPFIIEKKIIGPLARQAALGHTVDVFYLSSYKTLLNELLVFPRLGLVCSDLCLVLTSESL